MITSTNNKVVKYLKSLKYLKNIKKHHEFIVEGEHLVEEAYKSNMLNSVYILESNNFDYDVKKEYVTANVMKHICSLKTNCSIIGLCKKIKNETIIGEKIVLSDGIQDPGNMGTIIRSCVAFGVDTLVVSEDTVNIYNEKVLRGTQGMIFKINIVRMNLSKAIEIIKTKNIELIGTSMKGIPLKNVALVEKYALILGNEGLGVKQEFLSDCDKVIKIEMDELCESLNVAVAGSIIMYKLR